MLKGLNSVIRKFWEQPTELFGITTSVKRNSVNFQSYLFATQRVQLKGFFVKSKDILFGLVLLV